MDYAVLSCVAAVLVVVTVVFFNSNPYSDGCRQLKKTCDPDSINSIIAVRNSTGNYTLGNLCAARGYTTSLACADSCGCDANGTASVLSEEPLKSYTDSPVNEGVFIVRK